MLLDSLDAYPEKDVGVPRRACSISAFHVARLRLNDGAKLWTSIKHYLKTQNILQTFAFVALERNFLPKMELPQTFLQNFAHVASEKILSPKNGVASKFLANFCLCSIRKKTFSQKWSCLKIPCKFLLV